MNKVKSAKYKMGDMVYSYQNPTVKREVNYIRLSDDPKYDHMYKLSLRDREGYSYSSNFINEKSLHRTKRAKR